MIQHCEMRKEGVLLRIFKIRYKALSRSKISRKKVNNFSVFIRFSFNLDGKSSEITDIYCIKILTFQPFNYVHLIFDFLYKVCKIL